MLILLALVTAACERGTPSGAGTPAPPPATAERSQGGGPARTGVEVPMPPGWTASLGPEQSFQAGPPGAPVLRIDRRARASGELPSPQALREGLAASLRSAHLTNVQEEQGSALSLLFFDVVLPGGDGGGDRVQPGMVGAKAVGEDLFLCASLGGASAEDVRAAAKACRELTVRAPGALPQ